MGFGLYLGASEQFNLMSAHAHTGLLGGVWSMIFSWLFARKGDPLLTGAARLQWLGWNLGAVSMVTAFVLFNTGNPNGDYFAVPGVVLLIGTAIWIAVTVWPRRA